MTHQIQFLQFSGFTFLGLMAIIYSCLRRARLAFCRTSNKIKESQKFHYLLINLIPPILYRRMKFIESRDFCFLKLICIHQLFCDLFYLWFTCNLLWENILLKYEAILEVWFHLFLAVNFINVWWFFCEIIFQLGKSLTYQDVFDSSFIHLHFWTTCITYFENICTGTCKNCIILPVTNWAKSLIYIDFIQICIYIYTVILLEIDLQNKLFLDVFFV